MNCNSRHVRIEVSNPSRNFFIEYVVCGKCRHKEPIWSGTKSERVGRARVQRANKKKMRAAARRLGSSDGTT